MAVNKPSSSLSATAPTTLQTLRLTLRAAQESDLPAFHSWLSNPEVVRYWSRPPHTSIEQSRSYLARMIESPNNGVIDFVLALSPSIYPSSAKSSSDGGSTVIGKAGIWSPASHPVPEIGLLLGIEHWRKGYMSEAFKVLIPHFWKAGVEVVRADVDPRNEASMRLLGQVGFVEVGRERKVHDVKLGEVESVYLETRRPGL